MRTVSAAVCVVACGLMAAGPAVSDPASDISGWVQSVSGGLMQLTHLNTPRMIGNPPSPKSVQLAGSDVIVINKGSHVTARLDFKLPFMITIDEHLSPYFPGKDPALANGRWMAGLSNAFNFGKPPAPAKPAHRGGEVLDIPLYPSSVLPNQPQHVLMSDALVLPVVWQGPRAPVALLDADGCVVASVAAAEPGHADLDLRQQGSPNGVCKPLASGAYTLRVGERGSFSIPVVFENPPPQAPAFEDRLRSAIIGLGGPDPSARLQSLAELHALAGQSAVAQTLLDGARTREMVPLATDDR